MATITIPIDTPLVRGDCYWISYSFSDSDGSLFTFKAGETEATATTLSVVDVDGDTQQNFNYPLTGGDDYINLYIVEGTAGVVSNLLIQLQEDCATDLCSEQLELDTCTLPNRPLMKLKWTNNEDGLGFAYSYIPLIQTMYVKGALRIDTGVYDSEDYYTDSKGTRSPIYVDAKKRQEMWINQCPAYVHDALRIALVHDSFTIDGVEYTKAEGGYDPDWDVPNSLLAPVSVGVRKADQDTINNNC